VNAIIEEIEQGVNQRVTQVTVRNTITQAGFDIDSLVLLPRSQTVAFVWRVTLKDGTRLAAKAVGWIPLSRRVERQKPTELFNRVALCGRLRYEAKRLLGLHELGCGPRVLASTNHVIAMDWVEGQTLDQALPRQPHVLNAVIDLISRLQAKGFHHGDLHAGNVLIGPEGTISLLDPSFRFVDAVSENERALFDYALLLGSLIAAATVRDDLVSVVDKAIEHLQLIQGAGTVVAMYDFARVHSRENRFLGALLSQGKHSTS
jgi:tRNA A-37 threonylcarbamoyl transferase component Bud32